MYNLNYRNLIITILASSITFYAAKYTQYSPIYFIYLILIPPSIIILTYSNNIYYSKDMLLALFLIIYMFVTQLNFLLSGEFINLLISIYSYIFIRASCNKIDISTTIKILTIMLRISIATITVDTLYRITHPSFPDMAIYDRIAESEELWFYIYKFNTFMFADSNTTGLVAVILLFSIISIEKYLNYNFYKYEKIILLLLVLFSISRAAYVATIFGLILNYIIKRNNIRRIFAINFGCALIVFYILNVSNAAINDDSLDTKLNILLLLYEKIYKMSFIEILFGVGLGQSPNYLGVYSHLLFITYFIESGLIGLCLLVLFILVYILRFNSTILLPTLVVGLSSFTYLGAPFLFVPLAIIANILTKVKK